MAASVTSMSDAGFRAAQWYARLQAADCSAEDRLAFERWCVEDPAHIEAWLAVAELHAQAARLRDDPAMRSALRSARASAESGGWGSSIMTWAVAACLLFAVVLLGYQYRGGFSKPVRYATTVGEQRDIALSDGTRLVLDTDSVVHAHLHATGRQLEVEKGRVSIDVASDPNRAFEVIAGSGRVRDIGTLFQVQTEGGDVTVTLIEGAVAIRTGQSGDRETLLSPGQMVSYDHKGTMGVPAAADLQLAQGWTRGQIIFNNRPLDDLLSELNRYSSVPLRLANAQDGKMMVSGVFNVDDRDALLRALEAGWGLKASQQGSKEIVLSRVR